MLWDLSCGPPILETAKCLSRKGGLRKVSGLGYPEQDSLASAFLIGEKLQEFLFGRRHVLPPEH